MNRSTLLIPILLAIFCSIFSSCIEPTNPYEVIPPGPWRAVLYLEEQSAIRPAQNLAKEGGTPDYAEKSESELPFLFDVTYDSDTTFYITIKNGEERIPVRDVDYSWDRSTSRWSIRAEFPIFDSHIEVQFEEEVMQGYWVVHNRDRYQIPFAAWHGKTERFTEDKEAEAEIDVNGKWAVHFDEGEKAFPAIAEFVQSGKQLTGTFLTKTGDYRYLEGMVEGKKLYLSVFDGTHAFLYHAKLMENGKLEGFFKSGKHYQTSWSAERDASFQLPDADSLTYWIAEDPQFRLTLPDSKGNLVSIHDPKFDNKVKIVQILGTWCPNCMDETNFLLDYIARNPDKDIQLFSIAFEKYRDKDRALAAISRFVEKKGIPYPVLHGGYASKEEAAKVMNMINAVVSYPTMIFIDKNQKVRRIHTGFQGPATSSYAAFANDFDSFITQLLEE